MGFVFKLYRNTYAVNGRISGMLPPDVVKLSWAIPTLDSLEKTVNTILPTCLGTSALVWRKWIKLQHYHPGRHRHYCLFVCLKKSSLTTHLGMVICTHYLARVCNKLTQGLFLQTFTSLKKCHFKDHVCVLKNAILDGTLFALAFCGFRERVN